MEVIQPQSPEEFENYYNLRWEVLRKPWGKPRGSEQDEDEHRSVHAMICMNGEVVAVGRLHFNSPAEAQIRYMAVREDVRGKGVGEKILSYLESVAKQRAATLIILQARENAVKFYERNGYSIKEKSFLLWDEIQHYLMEKALK